MRKLIRSKLLLLLGLPKTLFFNFWYLPFRQAVRLPFVVSHRVWLMELGGRVELDCEAVPGMVELGFGEVGIFDQHRSRTVWQVSGEVIFKGAARIGHGSKLSVSGRLELGAGFTATAEASVIATSEVVFGRGALLSWETLVMDTDFHSVYDSGGRHLNPDAPVRIGERVWLGCRSMVLKGVTLAPGTVVAAGSVVSRSVEARDTVVGGSPAAQLRENVTWGRYGDAGRKP